LFFLAVVALVILFFVYLIFKKHKNIEQEETANQTPITNDDSLYSEILDTNIGKIKYYETRPASVMYIPSDKAVPGLTVTEDEYVKLLEYKKRENMLGKNHGWLIPTNIYSEIYEWPGYE
jgi:hypothetical protein